MEGCPDRLWLSELEDSNVALVIDQLPVFLGCRSDCAEKGSSCPFPHAR